MPQLLPGHKGQFEMLRDAVKRERAALMDCQDVKSGESVAVICLVNSVGEEIELVPIARLFNGNPYEEVNPPNIQGGYLSQGEVWHTPLSTASR